MIKDYAQHNRIYKDLQDFGAVRHWSFERLNHRVIVAVTTWKVVDDNNIDYWILYSFQSYTEGRLGLVVNLRLRHL